MSTFRIALFLSPILALGGCAASAGPGGTALVSGGSTSVSAETAAPAANSPAYVLSDEEKGIDCKRLTGRMKIRILQIRDDRKRVRSSELSRSLHAAQGQFGGSAAGSDPDGDAARDRAMLAAYNGQLAAKGCKTLDLEAELKP